MLFRLGRINNLKLFGIIFSIFFFIFTIQLTLAAVEKCSATKTDYVKGDRCLDSNNNEVAVPVCSQATSNSFCYTQASTVPGTDDQSVKDITPPIPSPSPTRSNPSSSYSPCPDNPSKACYTFIEPVQLEGAPSKYVVIEEDGLGKYLGSIFIYLIMLIVVASVFYMIYGGVLYLTTDIINKKLEGREVIQRVVIGLIFVFSVWTIMNTINPNILNGNLNFGVELPGSNGSRSQVGGTIIGTPITKCSTAMSLGAATKEKGITLEDFKAAIAAVESRGKGGYNAVGQPTSKGNRAYGKYQTMDFNIPAWSQAAIGRSVSVQEFASSPDIQEKVMDYQSNLQYNKYKNWDDVASVWFSGRPFAGNNSSDGGNTVPQYISKMRANLACTGAVN